MGLITTGIKPLTGQVRFDFRGETAVINLGVSADLRPQTNRIIIDFSPSLVALYMAYGIPSPASRDKLAEAARKLVSGFTGRDKTEIIVEIFKENQIFISLAEGPTTLASTREQEAGPR